MGTPVPDPPIDYGDDCSSCTPPIGELWEPGKTPLYLYAYFAGIKACPGAAHTPPNGKTFKLTQSDVIHCVWQHIGSVWDVYFITDPPGPDRSRLVLRDIDGNFYFNAYGPGCMPECFIYSNEITCGGAQVHGEEGVGVIHWMGIAMGIVLLMSLPSGKPIMHELFVTDEEKIVHKFCHVDQLMNVKFLTE